MTETELEWKKHWDKIAKHFNKLVAPSLLKKYKLAHKN